MIITILFGTVKTILQVRVFFVSHSFCLNSYFISPVSSEELSVGPFVTFLSVSAHNYNSNS